MVSLTRIFATVLKSDRTVPDVSDLLSMLVIAFFVEKFSLDWIQHGSLGDSLKATFLKKLVHAGLPKTFFWQELLF